jgi:ATP-dependent Clp protease adaptor protein ClpS
MAIINLDTEEYLSGSDLEALNPKEWGQRERINVVGSSDDGDNQEKQSPQGDGLLLAEPLVKTKRPPYFKVVLLNDDYTPMDFVVFVLKDIFHLDHEASIGIMLEIHNKGAGVCGIYTRDVAETKAELVITLSRRNEYPLQCRVEKA